MSAIVLVQIDGETLPLKDCSWVQTAACGCIVSVATAAHDDVAYATEQQIHEHTSPTKRERDRDIKRGYTWQLITFEQYKARYGGIDAWKCPHGKAAPAAQATLDTPEAGGPR